MRKKNKNSKVEDKSIFTNLDKELTRDSQVYVNEEIMDAVLEAKKKSAEQRIEEIQQIDITPNKSTLKKDMPLFDAYPSAAEIPADNKLNQSEEDIHNNDLEIYDSLFSETTIVSTQIYTYEIDKSLGEDNYSTKCSYRVGQDTSDLGTLFSVTRKELDKQINFHQPHTNGDLNWYNDLAGLGFSYAAVCGTTVQGVIICEPQYWNNTMLIRHLVVSKENRLKGIGTMLIKECVNRAQVEGFRAVTMEITSKNGAAIDFLKKVHFSIAGMHVGLYSNSDILKEDVGLFMHRVIV